MDLAAAEAGVPGRFCAFEHNGLLALLTTAPGLDFLNSISGLTEAGTQDEELLFLDTLAAGYSPSPVLGRFLRAEHSAAGIRRFLAWQGDWPVAAAAFSVHRNAAVFGGAATVPAARRLGAQTALLNHRLIQAAVAGAHAAVVTAAPESASARNLARVGFKIRRRHGWN